MNKISSDVRSVPGRKMQRRSPMSHRNSEVALTLSKPDTNFANRSQYSLLQCIAQAWCKPKGTDPCHGTGLIFRREKKSYASGIIKQKWTKNFTLVGKFHSHTLAKLDSKSQLEILASPLHPLCACLIQNRIYNSGRKMCQKARIVQNMSPRFCHIHSTVVKDQLSYGNIGLTASFVFISFYFFFPAFLFTVFLFFYH